MSTTPWSVAGSLPCANAIIINDLRVLLVLKQDVLILPGGKHEDGEDDLACLVRELCQELPGPRWDAQMFGYWRTFVGLSPHRHREMTVKTYLADSRKLYFAAIRNTGAEIDHLVWARYEDELPVSDITRGILHALHDESLIA